VKEILHQVFFLSRRKYFKFYRYFAGRLRLSCGKFRCQPVEKNVENFASRFSLKFKNPDNFTEIQYRLWKIPESQAEKNFQSKKKTIATTDFDNFLVKNTFKIKIFAEIFQKRARKF
jgi:hypothetical protein